MLLQQVDYPYTSQKRKCTRRVKLNFHCCQDCENITANVPPTRESNNPFLYFDPKDLHKFHSRSKTLQHLLARCHSFIDMQHQYEAMA